MVKRIYSKECYLVGVIITHFLVFAICLRRRRATHRAFTAARLDVVLKVFLAVVYGKLLAGVDFAFGKVEDLSGVFVNFRIAVGLAGVIYVARTVFAALAVNNCVF